MKQRMLRIVFYPSNLLSTFEINRKLKMSLTFSVYVFVGEHIALIDFIKCLQRRNLLYSGDYVVISVDDEIYDPNRTIKILSRGEFLQVVNFDICFQSSNDFLIKPVKYINSHARDFSYFIL